VINAQIAVVNAQPVRKSGEPLIKFVRAGAPAKQTSSKLSGILAQARDWICHFDLPELRRPASAYVFPQDVCLTPLKIDGHVISRDKRICVGIELTAPMEHNIATWHTAKLKKYEDELRIEAERNRWTLHMIVIEVGARGWIPTSVYSSLARLGLPSVKSLCGKLSLLAVKSSYVIWLNRFNKDFQTWRISVGDPSAGGARTSGEPAPARSPLDGAVGRAQAQRLDGAEATKHSRSAGNLEFSPRLPRHARADRKGVCDASVSGNLAIIAGTEQFSVSDPTLVVPTERKVLVDGKWLREGKRSDVQPCSSGEFMVATRDGVPQPSCSDACDADPLLSDLDTKELIKLVTSERKVLVDGKWLREGKRSDVQPCSSGGLMVATRDGVPQPSRSDACVADPLFSDLDTKELIKLVTFHQSVLDSTQDHSAPFVAKRLSPGKASCLTGPSQSAAKELSQLGSRVSVNASERKVPTVSRASKLRPQSGRARPGLASSRSTPVPRTDASPASRSAPSFSSAKDALKPNLRSTPSASSKATVQSAPAQLPCPYCAKPCEAKIGLPVHLTRWCLSNPDSARWVPPQSSGSQRVLSASRAAPVAPRHGDLKVDPPRQKTPMPRRGTTAPPRSTVARPIALESSGSKPSSKKTSPVTFQSAARRSSKRASVVSSQSAVRVSLGVSAVAPAKTRLQRASSISRRDGQL